MIDDLNIIDAVELDKANEEVLTLLVYDHLNWHLKNLLKHQKFVKRKIGFYVSFIVNDEYKKDHSSDIGKFKIVFLAAYKPPNSCLKLIRQINGDIKTRFPALQIEISHQPVKDKKSLEKHIPKRDDNTIVHLMRHGLPLEQYNIDHISHGVLKKPVFYLGISDMRRWSFAKKEQMAYLTEKLNSIIVFLQHEKYKDLCGPDITKFEISVIFKYRPPKELDELIAQYKKIAKEKLPNIPITFRTGQYARTSGPSFLTRIILLRKKQ